MARIVTRVARQAMVVGLFVLVAVAGSVSGVLFAFADDLPRISALDDYTPSTITRVLDVNGEPVGEFAIQRRVVIGYDDMPSHLRQAVIAAEDADFESHFGLSISRIVVTLVKDILERRTWGASTLTQQLARKLFLTDEKTWERKIKEAILAIQIEKRYTKREILTLYANQMYLGHGAYGVEAGARLYFGKSVKDLTLEEAALIAGIFQGNVRQSPYVNMQAALGRRNYALGRMADEGYITRERAEQARQTPIVVRGSPGGQESPAPYFLEEVRKHVESRHGTRQLYEGGLTISTSLDVHLQRAANAALERGLRRLDKLRGFRKPERNVVDEGGDVETFAHAKWSRPMSPGDVVPAVVTDVERNGITFRAGALGGRIDREGYGWARRTPAQLVRPGDLIEVRLAAVDAEAGTAAGTLEQPPLIEGALLAIDNRSGQIRAMVGGFDFARSKFNRSLQARRQVGSTFKPFIYATAIDRGYTPSSIIVDEPTEFDVGPDQPLYAPPNYDRQFEGPITLRRALEGSRNVPAVKMMRELGPEQVIAVAHRLGVESPIPPFLSVALGAAEATLLELTRAYSAFPNQGVLVDPYFVLKVQDREGSVLEEGRPTVRDAIRADTAYVMTHLLEGVVLRGSGGPAAALNWPLAGKTGTTDDYTDAWFVGFDPDLTVGVWVGYDLKKPIGGGQTGAVAALPIWIEFVRAHIENHGEPPSFDPPGNILLLAVDRHTGQPVEPGTPGAITEAFIAGTQPGTGFPR